MREDVVATLSLMTVVRAPRAWAVLVLAATTWETR